MVKVNNATYQCLCLYVITCDVDRDLLTAHCLSSSGDEVHWPCFVTCFMVFSCDIIIVTTTMINNSNFFINQTKVLLEL